MINLKNSYYILCGNIIYRFLKRCRYKYDIDYSVSFHKWNFIVYFLWLDVTLQLDIGGDIMKNRMSGTYQVMPKVGVERASQTDESASPLYKGKGESRLFSCKTKKNGFFVFASESLTSYLHKKDI